MAHDFKAFPELTNSQMGLYYFDSPHKQIVDNFRAKVVKVTDGDTIRVEVDFRNFNFPIRIAKLAAPELKEKGGLESQKWLSREILGQEVDVVLTKERVEKWGRLLAEVFFKGFSIGELSVMNGHAVSWEDRQSNDWGFL